MKSLFSIEPEDDVAFEALLADVVARMNSEARAYPGQYITLQGSKLEDKVVEMLRTCARGTCFEERVVKYAGQRFPDIVVGDYYGVEVKTTKANHWKSTGSSVAEGTRVESVERVYLLFGKMCEPIEFTCKPYEACLSEVVVTHSPRYLVDMNLEGGETIFDKLGLSYDELRRQPNPIRVILSYYRSRLKEGEELWWLGNESAPPSSLVVRIWNSLSVEEKREYLIKGFVFFPELLSNHSNKFNRMAVWLATSEDVVCPNLRDMFSAGGREDIVVNGACYRKVSKVIVLLYRNLPSVKELIRDTPPATLSEYWEVDAREDTKWDLWRDMAIENLQTINTTGIPLQELIV